MAGRGPQSFKKRQKEQARKEKQQEKREKRLQRKQDGPETPSDSDVETVEAQADGMPGEQPVPQAEQGASS